MAYEYIQTENREGVFIITMHDPPTRNALGPQMADEIIGCLDVFEDDPTARVLLLTGTEPSFCSGANVRGFNQQIQDREKGDGKGEAASLPWGKMESQYARYPSGSTSCRSRPSLRSTGMLWESGWAWPWPATFATQRRKPYSLRLFPGWG